MKLFSMNLMPLMLVATLVLANGSVAVMNRWYPRNRSRLKHVMYTYKTAAYLRISV